MIIIVPHWITFSWYTGRWWVGCCIQYSEEAPPRCTECNSPAINDQCTNHRIAVKWSVALQLQCARQSVNLLIAYTVRVPNQIKQAYFTIFSLMFATSMIFLALQLVNNWTWHKVTLTDCWLSDQDVHFKYCYFYLHYWQIIELLFTLFAPPSISLVNNPAVEASYSS